MAYEDLHVFMLDEDLFAFHTKTAFLVQLDAPTAKLLSLRGNVSAFLEEYPEHVLYECTEALSNLYEEDLLAKELEVEGRKDPKQPLWVLDLAFTQDQIYALGAAMKATAALNPNDGAPLVLRIGSKKGRFSYLPKIPGLWMGTNEAEGVLRFQADPHQRGAILCLETIDPTLLQRLFREGTGRVFLDWGGWIPEPPKGLYNTLVSLMDAVWEENPKALLEPLSSWVRAMYEAVPPVRPPWIGVLVLSLDGSIGVKDSSCAPKSPLVSLQEVTSLLESSDTCKPVCRACPILRLCQGGHWVSRLKKSQAGYEIVAPDPRECSIAFDVFRAAVALYDRLDRKGLLKVYTEGMPKKEMQCFAWKTQSLSARSITKESLFEVRLFLKNAIDGGLFVFEKFFDPSWREVQKLLEEDETKRSLVMICTAEGDPCGFLWLTAHDNEHRADASLWISEKACEVITPFEANGFLKAALKGFNMRKLSLFVLSGHGRLEKILEDAGAILEGVLPEAAFLKGGFRNVSVYACLKEKLEKK